MMFKEGTKLYSYEIVREAGQNVMYVNYLGANFMPAIADYADVMARTIDNLDESSNVSRIVFVQQRNYSHDFEQVKLLVEIAQLYNYLIKQERVLSQEKLGFSGDNFPRIYNFLNLVLNETLKKDIVKAYRDLKNVWYEQKALNENEQYVRFLEKLLAYFENLGIIKKLKPLF